MKPLKIRGAVVATVLAAALAGCGPAGSSTAESTDGSGPRRSSPASESPGSTTEQITPGGIAVIALEHLGPDAVRRFATFGPERGEVSLMIQLRDTSDHNFAVTVYSPKSSRDLQPAGKCPAKREARDAGRCRTLDNGTTVWSTEDPHGFSDDNADGMVIFASAITAEGGVAMAMYETYGARPAITAKDLENVLSDPRLTWQTDSALNRTGEDIEVKQSAG